MSARLMVEIRRLLEQCDWSFDTRVMTSRSSSRQRLNMTVPRGTQMDLGGAERSGFWVELRDSDGAALVRQALHDPIPQGCRGVLG